MDDLLDQREKEAFAHCEEAVGPAAGEDDFQVLARALGLRLDQVFGQSLEKDL